MTKMNRVHRPLEHTSLGSPTCQPASQPACLLPWLIGWLPSLPACPCLLLCVRAPDVVLARRRADPGHGLAVVAKPVFCSWRRGGVSGLG
jgi:hypothetical protein